MEDPLAQAQSIHLRYFLSADEAGLQGQLKLLDRRDLEIEP